MNKLYELSPIMLYALRELIGEIDEKHKNDNHRTGYHLDTGGMALARQIIKQLEHIDTSF